MLTPAFVSRLRRTGVWGMGQRIHRHLATPVCSVIHVVVQGLGARFFPTDLVLKHIYDYQIVYVDPVLIESTLYVGAWRPSPGQARRAPWSVIRRWFELGGGWKTARRHVTRSLHGRFVASGDWDRFVRPLEHRLVIAELFLEGRAPEETDEYQLLRRRIETGDFAYAHGCLSMQDLDEYFAALIRAFESIRTTGYKTQQELGLDGSDEIRVCIDRHGRLCLFSGGTHRLTIARVLELERVPILVKRVHTSWVADWMARTGTTNVEAAIADAISNLETRSPSHDVQA